MQGPIPKYPAPHVERIESYMRDCRLTCEVDLPEWMNILGISPASA